MKVMIALSARDGMKNDTNAYYIQQSYMHALDICNANYIGVIPNQEHDYEAIAKLCDGLLLCGGGDIDPKYYHQSLHESDELVEKNIDEMDFKLIEAFLKENKPILGICRGHQILNVYYGGTLIQDIPSSYHTSINHAQKEARHVGTHTIELVKDSFLGKKGDKGIVVNSFHHQNIDELGKSLEVIAYSEDGLIEAMQNESVMGVQWHPECMVEDDFHKNIIQVFVKRCCKG